MPFEIGNQHAKGHGRPRRLNVELDRLREAAGHARALIETEAAVIAMGAEPEVEGMLFRKISEKQRLVRDLDNMAGYLATLVDEPEARRTGRRRRPRLDRYVEQAIRTAIHLDRLIGEECPQ